MIFEFIDRGNFEPNLKRVNELLRARRDAMLAALDRHLTGSRWSHPEGGYFVWLELPEGTNAAEVLDRAKASRPCSDGLRRRREHDPLAYSYVTPEEIDTGVERLAAAVGG